MNIVGLLGRITGEIVIKETKASHVANFEVTVEEAGPYNSSIGGKEAGTFAIEVWGKLAVSVEDSLAEGDVVCIAGALKQERWSTTDGSSRERIKIAATSVRPVENGSTSDLAEVHSDEEYDPFAL